MRIFLDANVYFSAARSPQGGSSAVCELIKAKKLALYTRRDVLHEAERNIRQKEPISARLRFYELMTTLNAKIVAVGKQNAQLRFAKIINKKDTHVLEGARVSKADFLVTLDKKHFQNEKVKRSNLPFAIVSPGELLKKLSQS